ncbi:MAG: ATP-dependent Clp protease ATP-binding subunit, partial [Bacteroidales bacterium]|nr:ATP-dependent Clp protease ATP-binding subunit [Bacteroidales bacterium]
MENSLLFLLLLGGIFYLVQFIDKYIKRKKKSALARSKSDESVDLAIFYSFADRLNEFYNSMAHPQSLLMHPTFAEAVKHLNVSELSNQNIIEFASGGNMLIACIAYEVLKQRQLSESELETLIYSIGNRAPWVMYFAFRTIHHHSQQPVVARIILQVQDWWLENVYVMQVLNPFISDRLQAGEKISFGSNTRFLDNNKLLSLEQLLNKLNRPELQPLREEIAAFTASVIDQKFLNSFGRIWKEGDFNQTVFEYPDLLSHLAKTRETLFKFPNRSLVLLGETGVGKTTLIRRLALDLQREGWSVFEASASDVLAGQIYIGQLEERLQSLVKNIHAHKKVIWLVPNFHELFYAGKHQYNPVGILERILPEIERGSILIIGETTPEAFEQLIRQNKRLGILLEKIRLQPLDDARTLEIATDWAGKQGRCEDGAMIITDQIAREALNLSKQYLSDKAAPGNLLDFLKFTYQSLEGRESTRCKMSADDLYLTLSHLTGLPRTILDERETLELQELRNLFERRVLGQPEAVDCLIERVAMIKTGLTDPRRPAGVFLFVGPTGTGKTEIAKSLAEFLFGSPDRMIRLDMSEYQTPGAIDSILGEQREYQPVLASSSLFTQIRKQPFSVILLDEFEKAHPNIWDLFLQVFDDGRLTDRTGNTANFRHSIIILTSNLGGKIQIGESIGFNPNASAFSMKSVEKSIRETFRREFINRLDRVIIFRPLSRKVMREILQNELKSVMNRRGLRMRDWAVEWEDSAVEFLLDKGFTPDLGARPLKRAIEQYLLSPLALTIINHQLPEGDQFLFVRSDGQRIEVEFIDPEAPEEKLEIKEPEPEKPAAGKLSLNQILLDPKSSREEASFLRHAHAEFTNFIRHPAWEKKKGNLLNKINVTGFWDNEDRFKVLGEVEYMERIETGLKTADSLLNRLFADKNMPRDSYSPDLIIRLAQQLYLLEKAHQSLINDLPKDAFLKVEVGSTGSDRNGIQKNF